MNSFFLILREESIKSEINSRNNMKHKTKLRNQKLFNFKTSKNFWNDTFLNMWYWNN
jgi:hypothetical protein